jgi:hypothetical protein
MSTARAPPVYEPKQRSLSRVQAHRERQQQQQRGEQVKGRAREAGLRGTREDPEKHDRARDHQRPASSDRDAPSHHLER